MSKTREKVIKLLNLTRSENDNEALLAVRKANGIVLDWGEFFTGQKTREKMRRQYGATGMPNRPAPSAAEWTPTIKEMLDECVERVEGSGAGFIESLAQQFHERGSLSQKQVEALVRFYRNLDNQFT